MRQSNVYFLFPMFIFSEVLIVIVTDQTDCCYGSIIAIFSWKLSLFATDKKAVFHLVFKVGKPLTVHIEDSECHVWLWLKDIVIKLFRGLLNFIDSAVMALLMALLMTLSVVLLITLFMVLLMALFMDLLMDLLMELFFAGADFDLRGPPPRGSDQDMRMPPSQPPHGPTSRDYPPAHHQDFDSRCL